MWSTAALLSYGIGFASVIALVPIANRLAIATGAVAHPRADRWASRPVPTLGGVAIASGMLAGVVALPLAGPDRLALMAGILAMLLVGLRDDLRGSGAVSRLLVEAVTGAAFAFLVTGDLPIQLQVTATLVSALAVPVAVNATNLVDNSDGLAASLSIVTAATLAAIGTLHGLASEASGVAVLVALGCLGFLVFNRPPARVFMGDAGSLSLGFALAAVSILIVRDALLIPGTLHLEAAMALPVAWALQAGDVAMVTVTRWRRGVSPFRGGVDHTSHRLLSAGLSPMVMVIALGVLAALAGAIATAAAAFFGGFALTGLVSALLLLLVGGFEAGVVRRFPVDSEAPQPGSASPDGTRADGSTAHVARPERS